MKLYKISLLALLLTVGSLYLIRDVFLSKEITVSAYIDVEKDLSIQIFWMEKEDEKFNEKQSVIKNISSGKNALVIDVPTEHIEKFRFDFGSHPGKVILSNLKLEGTQSFYPNYNDFIYNQYIKEHFIENNKLSITSDASDPFMIYKDALNLSAGCQVDWCRLMILFCFLGLIYFKGINYLLKFRTREKQSVVDILFLTAFFAMLFVPMSHISDAEKSEQENRMLAKKPQLLVDSGEGGNYGVQFDAWYNDRFWGRSYLVGLQKGMMYLLGKREMGRVILGKDNFLFSTHYDFENRIRNNNLFSDEDMILINANLNLLNAWAKSKDIRIFLEINPDKETIYEEYMPNMFRKVNKHSRREQLLSGLNTFSNITVVSSMEKLMDAKEDGLVFAKSGTHPTDFGAYIIYKNLIENINKYYPNVGAYKTYTEKFDKKVDTDILKNLGISEILYGKKDLYSIANKFAVSRAVRNETRESKRPNYKDEILTYQNNTLENAPRVFIISDSFFLRYINYMQEHFSKIIHVFVGDGRTFELENYGDKIDELKPNIIIISTCERFLERLKDIKKPKEK